MVVSAGCESLTLVTLPLQHSLVLKEPLGAWAEGEELGRAPLPQRGSGTGEEAESGGGPFHVWRRWERGLRIRQQSWETHLEGASAPELLSPP